MQDEMTGAVDAAASAAASDPSTFVASNGLRFKLKHVPQFVILEAGRKMRRPKPPVMFNEDKQRDEENPGDPDYLERLRNFNIDIGMLGVNTYYMLGTQLVRPLPDDIDPPESPDWVERLRVVSEVGDDVPDSGPRRYLLWMKMYALPDKDSSALLNACVRFAGGTLEVDVQTAQETFPHLAPRDTVAGVPAPPEDRRGDIDGADAGDGAGSGGEGSSGLRALPVGPLDTPGVA